MWAWEGVNFLHTGGPALSLRAEKLRTPRTAWQCPRTPHTQDNTMKVQRPRIDLMWVGSPSGIAQRPTQKLWHIRVTDHSWVKCWPSLLGPQPGGHENWVKWLNKCLLLKVVAWIPLITTVSLVKVFLQLLFGICLPWLRSWWDNQNKNRLHTPTWSFSVFW